MTRKAIHLKAVRYEAFISGDLKVADVEDSVGEVAFVILGPHALVEIGTLLEGALETLEWGAEPPPPGRRFSIRVSGDRKRAYLTDHESGKLFIFPERENLTELRELLERVTETMEGKDKG